MSAVIVAVVKNDLTDSKSFKLLAKEPTDCGCCSNFMSKTFSKIIDDIIISLFLPASSNK